MVTMTATRYPTRVLTGGDALVLFAAGFLGVQDAAHVRDAGMRATCVDIDGDKIADMAAVYPSDWEWVVGDVFDDRMNLRDWDVVSLDPPTSLFDKCALWVGTWCDMARRAVVLGTGIGTEVDPPAGWHITEVMPRSNFQGGVYWTVIEPC